MFFCSETFWQNLQLEAKMSIMKQFKLTKLISCCIFNDILLHLQPVAWAKGVIGVLGIKQSQKLHILKYTGSKQTRQT